MKRWRVFFHDESGATAVEYGLLLAFIAIMIVTAVNTFGTSVMGLFNKFNDNFP
jgi:pilus assembly protein Flp/PilA